MDWNVLETKKENSFKEQVNQIYKSINYFQTKIISEIQPKLVSEEILLDSKNWWHIEEEGLHIYSVENDLFFANSMERSNYASFMEKNVAFTRLPEYMIRVLPEEKLRIHFEVEQSEGIQAKLAIAEYDGYEKEQTTLISVEEEQFITLGKNTEFLRLALKVSGKGIVRIKNIILERIFQPSVKGSASLTTLKNPIEAIKEFRDLKVACIFDEFTMTNYSSEVDLITFTPENWQTVLTENKPHILFVESAWHGNFDSWQYKIGKYANVHRDELFALLKWCKEQGIPTLFWNKEDPIHFEKFIDSAKRFDYIFTSDANKIEDYKKQAKHEHVYALPFAANPTLHNPIQLSEPRKDAICFAGSYYANRHQERRQIMDEMLEISKEFGLVIYDRNFERTEPEFRFPKQFSENVVGSLPYNEIDKAYKGYRFMLNVNSVIHSPTMFSRRVFEGMACGTPIISSYSEGIDRLFGNLVMISQKPEELRKQLQGMKKNETLYRRKSLEGIREIYEKHTYKHRLQFILGKLGVQTEIKVKQNSVTVIYFAASENDIRQAINEFEKQSYPEKQLAIFIQDIENFSDINHIYNDYQSEKVAIYLVDYLDHYSDFFTLFSTDFMTMWNDKHFYGRNYLKDLMLASIYTDADFIGKSSYFLFEHEELASVNQLSEYIYTSELLPSRSIIRTDFSFKKGLNVVLEEFRQDHNLAPYMSQGAKFFSSDKFNFIENGGRATKSLSDQVEI